LTTTPDFFPRGLLIVSFSDVKNALMPPARDSEGDCRPFTVSE
jgi:hypothetical protein